MSRKVRSFLFKIFILGCMIVSADFVAGLLLKKLFYKQRSGKYFITSHALTNPQEQVMIFGNSHAAQHFDAPLLQKELGESVFNFGNQGQSLFYVYPILKVILASHKPKLILLNVDYTELRHEDADYERLSVFLPYYKIDPVIDSAIAMSGKNEQIKAMSAMYRFNSTIGYMLLNTFGHSYNKSMESLGYDPFYDNICKTGVVDDVNPSISQRVNFDTLKMNCLMKIIRIIKAADVKLLVTTTPLFEYNGAEAGLYRKKLIEIFKTLNVRYLDYGTDSDFSGKCDLFHDVSHMNALGADKWTTLCADLIKKDISR
ncbi:MAG TPA: hypothetical protein VHA56_17395 [Mucilaginibacter sp.]|nr:hypothetical protein [Mucilaginibacter sp.]